MVHQSQSLTLRFEAGDHFATVHAGFHQLEGHAAADRFPLLGEPDLAHSALADFLDQIVAANCLHAGFSGPQGGGQCARVRAGRRGPFVAFVRWH